MKDLEMLHGALNLVKVNAGLKPEEKALIVCDTENIDIAKVLAYAVKSVGAEYSICIMEPRSTHGEDPTEAIQGYARSRCNICTDKVLSFTFHGKDPCK